MASTYGRYRRLAGLMSGGADAALDRLTRGQRGPYTGDGRGPGRPWGGIVEETPALWVTWLVAASKRLGRPVPAAILIDGQRVDLASARLTFGPRWYFLCPLCGRRCEVVYLARGASGCRQCLRLGYKSQAQRLGSIWGALDVIFDRDGGELGRYRAREDVASALAGNLRDGLQAEIRAMLARVAIPEGAPAVER